jgi:hypothetical protein
MSIRIIISDTVLTGHPESVRSAISVGYGSDISAQCEINTSGLSAALLRAVEVDAIAVIRSTTGVNNYISLAQGYYNNYLIQTFMPLGNNSYVELSTPTSIPVIIICGAGDEELQNNTGYGNGLEFWDWDLSQTTDPTGDQSSYSNGIILGKILKIKDTLNCSWWEARYRARMTCPRTEPNRVTSPWEKINGYGRIDVSASTGYSETIIADPYYTAPPPEVADPPTINHSESYTTSSVTITFTPEKSSGVYRYKYDDNAWANLSSTTIPETTLEIGSHTVYVQEYWNDAWSESGVAVFTMEDDMSNNGWNDGVFKVDESSVMGTTGGFIVKVAEAVSATLSGASGSIAVNVPLGCRILGVQLRVDTLITSVSATTWTAVYVNTPTTAICSGQAFAKNTKYNAIHSAYEVTTGVVTITITPNTGTFTAGVVRAVVYYNDFDSMASL